MADDSISNQIYLSRDNIRLQMIEYMRSYLELENVDLVKGSFLSYLINVISTLTSNLFFYSVSTYREFYLTQAQLPESVLNLSAYIGYTPKKASFAIANLLVTIPLTFQYYPVVINIPSGISDSQYAFSADDVQFITYYDTVITITSQSQVSIVATLDVTRKVNLSFDIVNNNLLFILPLNQYSVATQEFQIDSDLQAFQFFTIDVPTSGSVASISVEVSEAGSNNWVEYAEFQSLYLLSYDTKGYISRRTATGVTLYFGNGLIGVQPPSGGTIRVTTEVTVGEEGNVLAGTITGKPRIYTADSTGISKALNYTVTNPSAAYGGSDEESIDQIRSNSIANLVAMNRLVTEDDYKSMNSIVQSSPLTQQCLPILKRSDIIKNEIALFINFSFGDTEIVPTRNTTYTIPNYQNFVSRGTVINVDGLDYYTLYDLVIERLNRVAYYNYTVTEINLVPTLDTTYPAIPTYPMTADKVNVKKTGSDLEINIHYNPLFDPSSLECEMYVEQNNNTYQMFADSTSHQFFYILSPYTKFLEGKVTVYFKFKEGSTRICDYVTSITAYESMNDSMMSNITIGSTDTIIYDIPVILKSYYDSIDQVSFELSILQYMLRTFTFLDYRMLTDFVNLKFTNTWGKMSGMLYNPVKEHVVSIGIPNSPIPNNVYIVSGDEGSTPSPPPSYSSWKLLANKYASFTDSTNLNEAWIIADPMMDDIISVENEGGKVYVYTGEIWFFPYYDLPLKISVNVWKRPDYYGSDLTLISSIQNQIYNTFNSRFGSNVTLYRSEIVDVVQSVSGVRNCDLVLPESNIFFSFPLSSLTKDQLLRYGPDHIYFRLKDISVKVF